MRWFPVDGALREASMEKTHAVAGCYFARTIMKELRLVGGYDVLYGKVNALVRDELFDRRRYLQLLPGFFVKQHANRIVIVETKGQEDLDVPLKMERLRQWCKDLNEV